MKPPCWHNTHLIRSNMASTVLTSGLLPVRSISSTFWLTPGLMLTTSTIPVVKESLQSIKTFPGHLALPVHPSLNQWAWWGQAVLAWGPWGQPKCWISAATSAAALIALPFKWSRGNASCVLKNFFFKDFIYLYLETGKGGSKRGRETSICGRNIDWLSLTHVPFKDPVCNPGSCPAGNRMGGPSLCRVLLNWSRLLCFCFLNSVYSRTASGNTCWWEFSFFFYFGLWGQPR